MTSLKLYYINILQILLHLKLLTINIKQDKIRIKQQFVKQSSNNHKTIIEKS